MGGRKVKVSLTSPFRRDPGEREACSRVKTDSCGSKRGLVKIWGHCGANNKMTK